MEYPRYFSSFQGISDGKTSNFLRKAQIPPQNLVCRLLGREMWGERLAGTLKLMERSIYQCIFPNFSVSNVATPQCFLRKFTPDGKHLIAFSLDQTGIEVYTFQGPDAAADLFPLDKKFTQERDKMDTLTSNSTLLNHIDSQDKDPRSIFLRENIFERFFRLKFRINLAQQGEKLNRECSLFTPDAQYMIAGSAKHVLVNGNLQFQENRNNESLESQYYLEDYSLHLVDLRKGYVSDTFTMKFDKIVLTHSQGIYLYNQTLAVLSIQHQTIHILHVRDGHFYAVQSIGRFCHEDDALIWSSHLNSTSTTVRPYEEAFLGSLKHRFLVYLYKRAWKNFISQSNRDDLTRFYQYYDRLSSLKMWRMQLLDEDNLLIKYSGEDVVTSSCKSSTSLHCIFVMYEISSTEIVAVFENTSDHLAYIFENFNDNFRGDFLTKDARYLSSPSNNINSKQVLQHLRETITSAQFGGSVVATKHILAKLPISSQLFSPSPYLDHSLFSYDDHRVSQLERPTVCGTKPLKFYGRDTGIYKFQIQASMYENLSASSRPLLVAFIFQPNAPFAITVCANGLESRVNFHVRCDHGSRY